MAREFLMPRYVISGENALDKAKSYFELSGKNALLITDPSVNKTQHCEELRSLLKTLGICFHEFSDIIGEPTDKTVNAALRVYKENGCDSIISLGGGSAIDIMKAVGLLANCGGKISDYLGKTVTKALPFMTALPTTAGTGSETTRFTVITDTETNVKMLIGSEALIPDLAVIDPQFTLSCPKNVTAATGLDSLTHAIESFTSRKAQPLTDTMAISACRRIFKNLPIVYENGANAQAREQMSIAAFEAGAAINNASVTLVHGMSRPIGAYFHVPHGISNAMLLEKCIGFALEGAYPKFAEIAREIGAAERCESDETAAKKLLAAIRNLCSVCEIPTLSEYGIPKEKYMGLVETMADDALKSGSPANTVRSVSKEDIVRLYKEVFGE